MYPRGRKSVWLEPRVRRKNLRVKKVAGVLSCGALWRQLGKKLGLGILSKALGLHTIAAILAAVVPQTGKGLVT